MADDYSKSRKTLHREAWSRLEQVDEVLLSRRQREKAMVELAAEADHSTASELSTRFPAMRTEN